MLEESEVFFEIWCHVASLEANLELIGKHMHLVEHLDVNLLVMAVFELFLDEVVEDVDMLRRHFLEEVDQVQNS